MRRIASGVVVGALALLAPCEGAAQSPVGAPIRGQAPAAATEGAGGVRETHVFIQRHPGTAGIHGAPGMRTGFGSLPASGGETHVFVHESPGQGGSREIRIFVPDGPLPAGRRQPGSDPSRTSRREVHVLVDGSGIEVPVVITPK